MIDTTPPVQGDTRRRTPGRGPASSDTNTRRTSSTTSTFTTNSSNHCAYGSVGGYNGYYVHAGTKLWLDISRDGGRTWEGRVGQVSISSTSPKGAGLITYPYLDSNRLARACTQIYSGPVSCTTWF